MNIAQWLITATFLINALAYVVVVIRTKGMPTPLELVTAQALCLAQLALVLDLCGAFK